MKGAPRIQIHGLRCQAHVGVPRSEQEARQELVIGLELEYDSRLAASRDDWPAATDYEAIADAVVALVEGRRVKLIEAVASLVADRVLEDPRVLRVRVEVGKPNALPRADTVRAILERERAPHTALVGLAAAGPGRAGSRHRVEALLRRQHEVRAESAERADPATEREGRALLLRTPMVLAELAAELHALASSLGAASGQARAVQLEVLVWNGERLEDRSRRWGFLDPALEELARAEGAAGGSSVSGG